MLLTELKIETLISSDLNAKFKEDVVREAQETFRRFMEWERKMDDQDSLEYDYPEYVVKNRAWTPVKMNEVEEDMYQTVDMTKDVKNAKKSKKQKRKEKKTKRCLNLVQNIGDSCFRKFLKCNKCKKYLERVMDYTPKSYSKK